jgi:ABC-type multidrug transport system fused ATPase/permease subunit
VGVCNKVLTVVVSIGGVDLRDVTEVSIRGSIALISQDVFLFDGTIRANIRDGNPDATDEDVADAARRAQLDSVISALPNGHDNKVGPNGNMLSDGQKHRVGIARALAKNAKVYIFDEVTSALDVENERLIMETVTRELEGATILFVTHRPSPRPTQMHDERRCGSLPPKPLLHGRASFAIP